MSNLKIYKSSAGSGKTFTLVLEFLRLVLKHPEDYKSILAITFTNKAAEEMKSRIIDALVTLSKGEVTSVRKILDNDFPEMKIPERAGKVLKNILHDYTSFSVTTIDSFFQRILRALAREIHLPLNMQVEVEIDDAILDITDRLMKEIGIDEDLTQWITELAVQKIDDDKGWNLEGDIKTVAKELFKEDQYKAKIFTREQIHSQYNRLFAIVKSFEKRLKDAGTAALQKIKNNSLEISDFSQKSKGVAGFFEKITRPGSPDDYKPNSYVTAALNDIQKWAARENPERNQIIGFASLELMPILEDITDYISINYKEYVSAYEVMRKIYLFGLINDLQKKISEYRNENNIILLSDTTRLLQDVIEGYDAPFIYEKSGNRYKHLLIDEFQDTSIMQWKNLLPLIINSLGSGFKTLIVGDAKQSVYRWRGGNMNLLISDLFDDLIQFKSMTTEEVLSMNFRSKKNIVEFNNSFFLNAPVLANEEMKMNDFPPLKLAYNDELLQATHRQTESGGFVKVNFISNESQNEDAESTGWKNKSLKGMLANIQELLDMGYSYRDICILVRRNKEGNEIADVLFENNIRQIISPDSLLVTASPRIEFLLNVFRFLSDNLDDIARTEILYYYQRYISKQTDENWHVLFSDHKRNGQKRRKKTGTNDTLFEGLEENIFNRILPEEFTSQLSQLRKLPVYELSERLVSIFKLNSEPDAYIQRFQDLVMEFTTKNNSSLEGFLQWWNFSSKVKGSSIIIPENTDAIRIMTIHGAKGLQFPVVMIPLGDWELLPKANGISWMKTEGTPFEDMERVAVVTGKRLKETYFSDEYKNEINQTVIDNLNLLYVAFTRAEDMLYISCIQDNEKELNSVSKLIYRTCQKIDPSWNGSAFEKGQPEKSQKKLKHTNVKTEYLDKYPIASWQGKLTLGSHSDNLLALTDKENVNKINYGILVHDVLSEIETRGDIERVIQKKVYDGVIDESEKEELRKTIEDVFTSPEINDLFDKSYTARTEIEIILPGGGILRPDRVLVKNNVATVVDFKSGKRDGKHETQLLNYMATIQKMDFEKVSGKIVYLAEKAVVDVALAGD